MTVSLRLSRHVSWAKAIARNWSWQLKLLTYRITFGVRQLEDDWKRQLNALIARLQGRFDAVLLQYGVPLLDEQNNPITEPRR